MNMRRYLLVAAASLTGLLLFLLLAMPDGGEVFKREGCGSCHRFKGKGGYMGPDLTAVTQRRSGLWIRRQIRNPKSHNPGSMMPSFAHLSFLELQSLIWYLQKG